MNGFISYAHDNHDLFEQFKVHLTAVENGYGIKFWSDQRINAGYHWDESIRTQIDASDLFILLLSPNFLASTYIWHQELPAIKERKRVHDRALIIQVLVEDCFWQIVGPIWQATPNEKGKLTPIVDWQPPRRGHNQARIDIGKTIETFYGLKITGAGV